MLYIQLSARQRRLLDVSVGQHVVIKMGATPSMTVTAVASVESHRETGPALYGMEIESTARMEFRPMNHASLEFGVIRNGEVSEVGANIRNMRHTMSVEDENGSIATNVAYADSIGSDFPRIPSQSYAVVTVIDQSSDEATEALSTIRTEQARREEQRARQVRQERRAQREALRRQRANAERRDRRIARRTPEDIVNPMPVGSWVEGEDCGDTRWYEVAGRTTQTRRSTL